VRKITYALPGNFDYQIFSSTFFAQVYNFGPDHTSRVAKYQNCWDFYDGKHWSFKAPEGYDQVTINYAKAFVKKLRRFAFRNGWTMTFTEEQRNDKIDKWVNNVWKMNDSTDISNKIAEFGAIFGDWYVYVQWLPEEDAEDEDGDKSTPENLKLSVIDPRYVFPQYNAKTGEMELCVIVVPYQEYKLKNNEFELTNMLYREIHTREKIFIQELDDKNDVMTERVMDNPLNKILIVHGIHQLKAGSQYGNGLIEDIIDSQKLFNEKTSNISEILDYHAAPITIIYGAKARQLEKGANKIWSGLPYNAKVENLSSEGNIPTAREFVQDAKQWMHELANIPINSLGAAREISNTAGVALSIEYEPLIEISEDVRFYFDKGIRKVNELIIDIGIYTSQVNTSLKGVELYEVDIEHGALLPRDRSLDISDITAEIAISVESQIGAMKRLGVKDIEAKQEEITKEEEEKQAKQLEMEKQRIDMQPKPAAGVDPYQRARKSSNTNPNTHGEQVSNAAKQKKS
jgi:hypothetical protein